MKLEAHLIALALFTGPVSAATVFTDTFSYTVNNAFTTEGGWTTVYGSVGDNIGVNANSGKLWGKPMTTVGQTEAALEYNYGVSLNLDEVLTMDATIIRTDAKYKYGKEIILWDGVNASSRVSRVDDSQAGGAVGTTTYTVTQADLDAGLNKVIFRYSHDADWGETAEVAFGITPPVPEPGSTAFLALCAPLFFTRRRR